MDEKERYMSRALELARRGEGNVSPNPMVGCVVVKDGSVIGEGYHEVFGGLHAERNALLACTKETEGAELYVNLEPCCHQGKTPPCTEIILERKIKKVYVGCLDPNPIVAGKGIRILREQGVEVECGILEEASIHLNEVFFHFVKTGFPFVAMKYAMTLDGKIACESGDSRWVTGEEARRQVHRLRNRYRGILAGIGTVLADDPMLNCRLEEGRDPIRIICDSSLRIPLGSQIVSTAWEIPTIIACCLEKNSSDAKNEKIEQLKEKGVNVLCVGRTEEGRTDLAELLHYLGKRGIDSILLEGGGTLNASMLRENLVQRVYAFLAPKLVAGALAKSPVEGTGIEKMQDAAMIHETELFRYGEDYCITGILHGSIEKPWNGQNRETESRKGNHVHRDYGKNRTERQKVERENHVYRNDRRSRNHSQDPEGGCVRKDIHHR